MLATEFDQILRICLRMARSEENIPLFKFWIEKKFFSLCKRFFPNNLPLDLSSLNKILPLFFITNEQKLIQHYKEIVGESFIELPEDKILFNSLNYQILRKFLEILRSSIVNKINNHQPNYGPIFVFVSINLHLSNNQLNLNIYNLKNLQNYVDLINLEQMLSVIQKNQNSIINLTPDGKLQNNFSFVHYAIPLLSRGRENLGIIFDLQVASDVNFTLICEFLNQLKKVYILK